MIKNIAVDCVLFEKCNLNCSHCFQNHINKSIDVNYIKKLPLLIMSIIDEEIAKKNPDLVMFSLRGGELFQDSINDDIINEYINMILEVKNKFKNKYPLKDFSIHLMSNGIYSNVDRVINLLKTVGGKITLSYDQVGRYTNEKQLITFFNNYKKLYDNNLIKNIAITLTKESIEAYINDVTILKKFDNSEIDFNYYIPTMKKSSLPSDDDLFNFYKFLLDNEFYNCIYIRNILENHLNNNKISISCNCSNTTVIYDGKAYRTCNIYVPSLNLTDFYGDEYKNVNENNGVKIITNKGLQKRKCFLCPYFGNCTYYCWMMLCYKDYQMQECPHSRMHQYINNNPLIMERYKKWL